MEVYKIFGLAIVYCLPATIEGGRKIDRELLERDHSERDQVNIILTLAFPFVALL